MSTIINVLVLIAAFLIAIISAKLIIPWFLRIELVHTVKDCGPSSHMHKTGTPTVGGIIFLIPIIIIGIITFWNNNKIGPIILVIITFALIGFLDDIIKIKRKNNDGLKARYKMIMLFVSALGFALYITFYGELKGIIYFPFIKNEMIIIPTFLYILLNIFIIIGFTNAVNLTDGIDGLGVLVTLPILILFFIITLKTPDFSYLTIFIISVCGGLIGFLIFNYHPAKIFMGDTGSLALGGIISILAVIMGLQWLPIIAGGILVIETLSVIIQVAYFKKTKKRIFKMAPIHHHFELLGWSEKKILMVFISASIVFCIIGFMALPKILL